MLKINLLLLLFVLSFSVKAQKKDKNYSKTIELEVLNNSAKKMQMLYLHLPLWELTGSTINSSLYDVNTGLYYFNPKFHLSANFKYGLGDKIAPETFEDLDYTYSDMMMSVYKPGKATDFTLKGTYNFFEDRVKEDEPVFIHKRSDTLYYVNIPAEKCIRYGFNIGYSKGFTWFNMNNRDIVLKDLAGKERTFNSSSMSSIQSYQFLRLGVTYSKAIDVSVKTKKYGKKVSQSINTYSFDVLWALQNDFDDVYATVPNPSTNNVSSDNNIYFSKYSINESNKKLPFGFDATYRRSPRDAYFSYYVSLKYTPGFINTINFMVSGGFNIAINVLKK
jgi:hypothetical protein